MRRLTTLATVLAVLGVAGCGGSSSGSSKPEQELRRPVNGGELQPAHETEREQKVEYCQKASGNTRGECEEANDKYEREQSG